MKLERFNNIWVWISIIVVIVVIYFIHTSGNKKKPKRQATTVVKAQATKSDVPVYITALGSVTPTYTVTVKTQINGTLLKVLYTEGQLVKAGDLLALIDERPFQAQLVQYQGQLIRDTALYKNALIDLKRYRTLWKQNSISQQTYATQQSLVKQYQGDIKIDEGLIQATQVNIVYCHIISPINGRIGLRLVDPGNFVQTSDTTGIAVVAMLNPITVVFSIAEDYIPDVWARMNEKSALVTEAYDRQQNKLLATGKLLTIDNQINTSTGTVNLKAQFQNEKNTLFPNQFVNVNLLVKTLHDATVVPTAAVQHTVNGTIVYVLNNKDMTVKVTPVIVGVTYGDKTTITGGIKPGDSIIVEGTDKLVDGAKVVFAQPGKNHKV